ncbi:unnamed protein product [Phyllotreta striolata]|uniref:Uncharacterized protein n=1 Tax=Phyllotreta striolata TaxID=444603 RepID=A0A9N9TLF1_PHYSR|nr:unnamed protein product [Phyllotreta striolata]
MKTSLSITLTILVCLYEASCFDFGKSFKLCHPSDPQIEKCLIDAIETGFKTLGSTGISAIGVAPIDPLEVVKITIGAGTSAVNLVQNYANVKIKGLSTLKAESANFDLNNRNFVFVTRHPMLTQSADYSINGKILVMPVFGKGLSVIKLKDAKIVHNIVFNEETKHNKKYFNVVSYNANITIGGAHYDFQNLFNGDRRLGDAILKVVNDNWSLIFNDVSEGVCKSYSQVFQSVATALFKRVPIEDMLHD